MERLTEPGFALGLRVKGNTQAAGTLDLRCLEFIPGQVAAFMRVIGKMVKDTDLVLRVEADGFTEENGPKGLREGMELDNQPPLQPSMRELGQTDSRMAMAPKLTLTEALIKASGSEVCGMVTESGPAPLLALLHIPREEMAGDPQYHLSSRGWKSLQSLWLMGLPRVIVWKFAGVLCSSPEVMKLQSDEGVWLRGLA